MNIEGKLKTLKRVNTERLPRSFVTTESKDRIESTYYFDDVENIFYAEITFGELAQGPPHHAHGGAISSVLDEAMGASAWLNNFKVVTAKLEVEFLSSVKLHEKVFIKSWVKNAEGRKVWMKAKLCSSDGKKLYSKSSGLFVQLNDEQIKFLSINQKERTREDLFF